ncbi:MAG: MFS transporter [Firmicutes bacterium]|jgi:GPH family glycoside/pentoside/hexuronide:cation symporter|nr:MFS transporter [Bacillota bacterium]
MTKYENTLSLKSNIIYGFGVSYAVLDQIFVQWVLYFYLPPENSGLSPLISPIGITVALLISRLFDIIFDPLVGYLSDNCKSKLGRRTPFILYGSVPLILSTILFFYPIKNIPVFLHLTVTGSLFFIFYSIVGAPYNALIPEISRTYSDRINMSTSQSVFRLLYSAIAMILPGILILKLGNGNSLIGLRKMVILLSILSLAGLLITGLFINEKKYAKNTTEHNKIKFSESIKTIFSNKSFVFYLGGLLFFFAGFNTLRTCINYYVEDIMNLDKSYITIYSAYIFITSGICFYPVNKLSKKFGYKKIAVVLVTMMIGLSTAMYGIGKFIPSSFVPYIFILMGIPISGCAFIFPPAMLSEIISKSPEGSFEGLYFGIQGFFLKLAFFISIGVVPLLLVSEKLTDIKSLLTSTGNISTTGIYNTTLFSIGAFCISLVFYVLYRE